MPLERISLKKMVFIFLMLSLQFPLIGGDARAKDNHRTIKVGGTGGAYGGMAQVAAAFQKRYPNIRFDFSPSIGSTGGIKAALSGALDLGMSARPLTAEERRLGAVAVEYGRTPLMLVTSYRGAEINFSLREIASLYSGELKSYPNGAPIRLILRPWGESDTSFLLSLSPEIAESVRKAQAREGMVVASTDQDNADALEKMKGAMGWMTLAQFTSEKRSLTPVSIENIRPSLETLASGAYPYCKTFSAVTGATPTPLVKSFIEFLTSTEGREIILENGLLVDEKRP